MEFLKDCGKNFATLLLLLLGVGGIVAAVVIGGGLLLAIILLPVASVNNTLLAREVPGWAVGLADLLTVCLSMAVTLTVAERLLVTARRWEVGDRLERFFNWALDRAR